MHILRELEEFFSGKKKEKKELRAHILEEYGREVSEDYDIDKLKELSRLLGEERDFLELHDDTEFTFFGYYRGNDELLPKFFYEKQSESSDTTYITATTPFTPKTFQLCMRNLQDEEKLHFSDNNELFDEYASKIVKYSRYQEENWDEAISKMKQKLQLECDHIEGEFSKKITVKDLSRVDWDSFCEEIKPYIAPSYNKKPENVEIKTRPSGQPVAYITMKSKTTPSYRTIKITGRDVSQSKNGSNGFRECNEEIHKIWKSYYRDIIKKYMGDIKDKSSSSVM